MKPIEIAKGWLQNLTEKDPYNVCIDRDTLKALCESHVKLHEACEYIATYGDNFYEFHQPDDISLKECGKRAKEALND